MFAFWLVSTLDQLHPESVSSLDQVHWSGPLISSTLNQFHPLIKGTSKIIDQAPWSVLHIVLFPLEKFPLLGQFSFFMNYTPWSVSPFDQFHPLISFALWSVPLPPLVQFRSLFISTPRLVSPLELKGKMTKGRIFQFLRFKKVFQFLQENPRNFMEKIIKLHFLLEFRMERQRLVTLKIFLTATNCRRLQNVKLCWNKEGEDNF